METCIIEDYYENEKYQEEVKNSHQVITVVLFKSYSSVFILC